MKRVDRLTAEISFVKVILKRCVVSVSGLTAGRDSSADKTPDPHPGRPMGSFQSSHNRKGALLFDYVFIHMCYWALGQEVFDSIETNILAQYRCDGGLHSPAIGCLRCIFVYLSRCRTHRSTHTHAPVACYTEAAFGRYRVMPVAD